MNIHASDDQDKLDELVSGLEELKTTVEELEMEPTPSITPARLKRVKEALDQANEETDKMEEDQDRASDRPEGGKH